MSDPPSDPREFATGGTADSTDDDADRALSHGSATWKVLGETGVPDGVGVLGHNTTATGVARGVLGQVDSKTDGAAGTYGVATASTGDVYGVYGVTHSGRTSDQRPAGVFATSTTNADGLLAESDATAIRAIGRGLVAHRVRSPGTGFNVGMFATAEGAGGNAIQAEASEADAPGDTKGVFGRTKTPGDAANDRYPVGVHGRAESTSGTTVGVRGNVASRTGPGVVGLSTTSGHTFSYSGTATAGVTGITDKTSDAGDLASVAGVEGVAEGSATSYGVYGRSNGAGYGLATPDDARIEGAIDAGGTDFSVLAGTTATGDATNVVHGHESNAATGGVVGATVGGGGFDDGVTVDPNEVRADYGTVGGGRANATSGLVATVAGGGGNAASGPGATVGGGGGNEARGDYATVAGGDTNEALAEDAVVCGGSSNDADARQSAILGGESHQVLAPYGTVLGGYSCEASGDSSLAWGYRSVASGRGSVALGREAETETSGGSVHDGAFVWSDDTNTVVRSTANNEVRFQATGGFAVQDGDLAIESGDLAIEGSNAVTDESANVHLTVNDGGPLALGRTLDANGNSLDGASELRGAEGTDLTVRNATASDGANDTASVVVDAVESETGDTANVELDVGASNGNLVFTNLNTGTGTALVIDSAGNVLEESSSARYKTDVRPASFDPGAVLDLEPRSFEFVDTGQEDVGLIAEEVEDVLPSLVTHDGEGRPESVRYDRLGVVLVPEVRRNRERIDDLEAETGDLRAETERLRAENDRLRERLATVEARLPADGTASAASTDD